MGNKPVVRNNGKTFDYRVTDAGKAVIAKIQQNADFADEIRALALKGQVSETETADFLRALEHDGGTSFIDYIEARLNVGLERDKGANVFQLKAILNEGRGLTPRNDLLPLSRITFSEWYLLVCIIIKAVPEIRNFSQALELLVTRNKPMYEGFSKNCGGAASLGALKAFQELLPHRLDVVRWPKHGIPADAQYIAHCAKEKARRAGDKRAPKVGGNVNRNME